MNRLLDVMRLIVLLGEPLVLEPVIETTPATITLGPFLIMPVVEAAPAPITLLLLD